MRAWSRTTKVLGAISARAMARHSHIMGRRRRWSIRCANTRVVLGAAPAESDARVADRVTLHLVDAHFRSVTVHELNKAATLAGRNLHVGNLAETLEERAQFILSDITRQSSDKHSSVVGVCELIHLCRRVEAVSKPLHATTTIPHLWLWWHSATDHGTAVVLSVTAESMITA